MITVQLYILRNTDSLNLLTEELTRRPPLTD